MTLWGVCLEGQSGRGSLEERKSSQILRACGKEEKGNLVAEGSQCDSEYLVSSLLASCDHRETDQKIHLSLA